MVNFSCKHLKFSTDSHFSIAGIRVDIFELQSVFFRNQIPWELIFTKSCFIPMGIKSLGNQIPWELIFTKSCFIPMGIKSLGNQIPWESNPLGINFY